MEMTQICLDSSLWCLCTAWFEEEKAGQVGKSVVSTHPKLHDNHPELVMVVQTTRVYECFGKYSGSSSNHYSIG